MQEELEKYKNEKVIYSYLYQDVAHSVIDRDLETETRLYKHLYGNYVHAYIDEILRVSEDKDFVRDDTYNGVHSDHHIMFKLRCDENGSTHLVSHDGHRGYEFLIEFDVHDTAYGIYYGCRGLILGGDQEEEINRFMEEWKELSRMVRTVLNNTFVNIDFIPERFQPTNNANNRTFWPFWISLYQGEDVLKVAARGTKLIYRVYKDYLESGNSLGAAPRAKKKVDLGTTRFTEDAYQAVLRSIKDKSKRDRFEYFLKRAVQEDVGLLVMDPHYEKAWRVKGDRSNEAFALFLEELCKEIGLIKKKKHGEDIPWSLFIPIMLTSEGGSFDAIKQSWYNISSQKKDDGNDALYYRGVEYYQEAAELVNLIMFH